MANDRFAGFDRKHRCSDTIPDAIVHAVRHIMFDMFIRFVPVTERPKPASFQAYADLGQLLQTKTVCDT